MVIAGESRAVFAGLTCNQSEMYPYVTLLESVFPKLRKRSSPEAGKGYTIYHVLERKYQTFLVFH